MKKLLSILLLIISINSIGQVTQQLGGSRTKIYIPGQLQVDSLVLMPMRDTNFIPARAGALVFKTGDKFYYYSGTKWEPLYKGATVTETDPTVSSIAKVINASDTTRWAKAFVDSIVKKSGTDSVFYYTLGAGQFAFIDNSSSAVSKIDSIKRKPGSDSVFYYTGPTQVFAFRDSIGVGEVTTGTNFGSGAQVLQAKVGVDFRFRTLVSSNTNLVITQNTNDITLNSKSFIDSVRKKSGTDSVFTYTGGTGTFAYIDASTAGGEANTAANVGSGVGVYQSKVGTELRFKSILTDTTIAATSNANDIELKVDVSRVSTVNRLRDTASAIRASLPAVNSLYLGNAGPVGAGIFIGVNDSVARFKKLIAGTNITLTEADSSIAINSSGIPDGDKTDITTSSSGSVWTIDNNVVTDSKIRQSAGLSVIGRSANSTGNIADILAGTSGHVLRRSGTTLGFGTIDSTAAPDLHTEAYYNTKYSAIGAGGSAAGSGTELQYRNAGSFGAMSGSSWDETNRKLTLAKTTSDSALLVFDGTYTGSKTFMKVRPPVKNDSVPEWHFISQVNANDDLSYTNHVLKIRPFAKDKNKYYGIGDEWEGRWRTGGATYFERHMEFYHHYNNESARLLSFTTISRDSMGNSQSQLDIRGNTFQLLDLKSNPFFVIGKSGNYTGVNATTELIGLNPYHRLTDETAPTLNYTTIQQSGPDIGFSSYRNYTFSSRQASKTFSITDMLLSGAAANFTTSVNWGANGLLIVNPSHASTGIARFQHSGTDALWINNSRELIINSNTDNADAKLQLNSSNFYWTGTPTALAGDTKIIVKGASDSLLKQSSLKTVNGTSLLGSGDIVTAVSTEGTYTVTLTNTTNISTSSAPTIKYQRVGDVVHVWGEFTATATATGVCEMGFSVPITGNFGNTYDGNGTGASDAYPVKISSDSVNGRMKFRWTAPNTSSTTHSFHFTYQIMPT